MRTSLPAIGQAYLHSDLRLSAQTCKNWYPELNKETSVIVSLQPWPGNKSFAATTGDDRGTTFWNGLVYKVSGSTLCSVNAAGVSTVIGTVGGLGRCDFPANTDYLVIVTSGLVYVYDGTTFTQNNSSELESPNYGDYLNNQWIYQGQNGRFGVSDAGDPFTINALSYASAESAGDPLVRPYVFNQILYLFGTKTVEQWYNSGAGDPPFDRIQQGIIQKGLGAADSVANNDRVIYFFGDDRLVYQLAGNGVLSITPPALARTFQDYADPSNAVGFTLTLNGQEFYILHFPNENTWAFNETSGGWFELTIGANERPYPVTSHVYAFGKHLMADDGVLLELDDSLNTYNGLTVIKERTTGLISGEMLGNAFIGKRMFMSRMEVIGKMKSPPSTAPLMMVDYSDDAGYTWSNPRFKPLSIDGNYSSVLRLTQLGSFKDRVFRYRISDDMHMSLHKVSGDFKIGNN